MMMNDGAICIKDLVFRLLLKWRIICLGMLIGCILVNIIGFIRSFEEVQHAKETLAAQEAEGGSQEEKTIVVPKLEVVSVKNTVLGVVIGALGVCSYILLVYVRTDRLKDKEDMTYVFKIKLLGSILNPRLEKQFFNKVDQVLWAIFRNKDVKLTKEECIRKICTDTVLAAQKAGMSKVYLTGTCNDNEMEVLKETFVQDLQGTIAKVSCGKSVVCVPESLEALVASEGVILFERVDASYYEDIQKQIELCKRYQIPIIGSIVLE